MTPKTKLHTGPGTVELPGGQRMLVRDQAQTSRNPITNVLEAYPGESNIAQHPFVGAGAQCDECHYPADALCHAEPPASSDQGE